MKVKWIAGILLTALTISACDEDTQGIGTSLTGDVDRFTILTDTFDVTTRSIIVDSVLAKGSSCYLGCMKDPETNDYVTSSYTTQFVQLEDLYDSLFPNEDDIANTIDGKAVIDSCHLNIYVDASVGDTLAPMKLTVFELEEAIPEGVLYYSDFDPLELGLIRLDGLMKVKNYTHVNYLLKDSLRNTSTYVPYINVLLNEPYTDKKGNNYNNYGSYILQNYFTHKEYFKNSLTFANNVCPGFYIMSTGGTGIMSRIYTTELSLYYSIKNGDEKPIVGVRRFSATEEVLQTSNIYHNKKRIQQLASDNTCTYLKTPAGIFTEVTLPIDEIMKNHEKDTIASAQIAFPTYNNKTEHGLEAATYIVMLPKSQLFKFFEERNLPDSKTSFLGTFDSSYNIYEFGNISTLVTDLYKNKAKNGADWNKVVLVPIERNSGTSGTALTSKVSNLMSLTSVRLVGGPQNTHDPIKISVIYSKSN